MHIDESKLSPGPTFAQHLANVGYKVLYVGKYLNISPLRAPTGAHTYMVNPGPSAHSALDKSGEYYPEYWLHINQTYNGTFNFSGLPQHSRYETAFIGNFTTEWLKEFGNTGPFMAYIAPHAPHGAAIPAPWYQDQFPNATAPITPSYNYSGADHHWLVAQQPPTRAAEVVSGNAAFRNRWRCLLSVDDMIISLRSTLQELGLLQSTYMMFSSGATPNRSLSAPGIAPMHTSTARLTCMPALVGEVGVVSVRRVGLGVLGTLP
jgi:N-acetylglucosamine-6-sulfatase